MNRWGVQLWVGSALTLVFLGAAILSFAWTPHDVAALSIADKLKPASAEYLLGTDHFGRDILSMLMVGARTSIAVALVAVGIGMALGVPLGLLAAANRGSLVDEVVMRNMPAPAAVNAMSAGQIPGIFPSLSQADVDRIAAARGDEVVTYDPIVTTVMFMVTINTQVAPFDDVRVRQALNLAIDRRAGSAALSKIASASGFGTLMRPGSQWARDGEELDALPGFEPDIEARREQARALLAEAGQSDLSFTFLNWNRYTPLGVFLIDQWRQIGVTVDQEALETAAFFGKTKAGDYVAMLDAIAEPSDDPTLRFGKMVSYSENPSNLARIDDPEFDRIYEAQGVELDTDKRIALVQELEDHMLDMASAVPLMWSVRPMVMDAKIKGLLTPYIASNYVGLDNATIWIDE